MYPLKVYNISGRMIDHAVEPDKLMNLASGVYFVRTGDHLTGSTKLIVIDK
jgi:hypothetical protein